MNSQKELLHTQTSTENQNTNNKNSDLPSQLVEKEKYEGTGFHIVGNKEQGYFVALGTYRLTRMQTKEECITMIENKDYELILGLIGASIEADKKATEQEKESLRKYGNKIGK